MYGSASNIKLPPLVEVILFPATWKVYIIDNSFSSDLQLCTHQMLYGDAALSCVLFAQNYHSRQDFTICCMIQVTTTVWDMREALLLGVDNELPLLHMQAVSEAITPCWSWRDFLQCFDIIVDCRG